MPHPRRSRYLLVTRYKSPLCKKLMKIHIDNIGASVILPFEFFPIHLYEYSSCLHLSFFKHDINRIKLELIFIGREKIIDSSFETTENLIRHTVSKQKFFVAIRRFKPFVLRLKFISLISILSRVITTTLPLIKSSFFFPSLDSSKQMRIAPIAAYLTRVYGGRSVHGGVSTGPIYAWKMTVIYQTDVINHRPWAVSFREILRAEPAMRWEKSYPHRSSRKTVRFPRRRKNAGIGGC